MSLRSFCFSMIFSFFLNHFLFASERGCFSFSFSCFKRNKVAPAQKNFSQEEKTDHSEDFSEEGEKEQCSICLDEIDSKKDILSCGHFFHESCFEEYLKHKISHRERASCPNCRANIYWGAEELVTFSKKKSFYRTLAGSSSDSSRKWLISINLKDSKKAFIYESFSQ